jgi:hypothetical protein
MNNLTVTTCKLGLINFEAFKNDFEMVADEIENYTLKSALNGYQKRVTFTLK